MVHINRFRTPDRHPSKNTYQALTAGGDQSNYRAVDLNLFTIRGLTTPYRATANRCRMKWLTPFAVLGIHQEIPEKLGYSSSSTMGCMTTMPTAAPDFEGLICCACGPGGVNRLFPDVQ